MPEYEAKYGTHLADNPLYGDRAGQKINYLPLMEVTYYGFRGMITLGGIGALSYVYVLWVTRKKGTGTVPEAKWLKTLALWGIWAPFFGNALGWIFTEMGRQPFVVAPNPEGDPSHPHVHGGSGFSGCERRRDTILTHRPRNGIRHPDGGRNLPAD